MRGQGINYDTGFSPGGVSSREQFDAGIAHREMQVIADDLHCTAVRISGGDPARLSVAGGGGAIETGGAADCAGARGVSERGALSLVPTSPSRRTFEFTLGSDNQSSSTPLGKTRRAAPNLSARP